MKKLLFLVFLPFCTVAQNTIGLPDIINYTKQAYSAGLQNWDIRQDKNGIVYFANNEGLLSFDGQGWKLYPLPNRTIVRSVEIGGNRIYAGGQDELGYFSPARNGQLAYHSLTSLIPEKYKSFGDVWDIVSLTNEVFFRSATKLFRLTGDKIVTYECKTEWAFLGSCNNRLYAQDYGRGLLYFENGVWLPADAANMLPRGDPVTAILSTADGNALITTLKNGIYLASSVGIAKQRSANSARFETDRIYAATAVNKEWIALATSNAGVYIVDQKGGIIQRFAQKEGIQNNNVLSIFLDNQSNLWLGLDNGIDFIAYNSAIKHINPSLQEGSGYTSLIHHSRLFVGTSNGLFQVPLQQTDDLSFSKGNFAPVANTSGQTWGLAQIGGKLLLGHHDGAFLINETSAQQLAAGKGFWNFTQMADNQVVAGNYNGLFFFTPAGDRLRLSGSVPGFTESSRFVVTDQDGNIWVSHPYHGVFRISRNKEGAYNTRRYAQKDGLPLALNNHVYKIGNQVFIATGKGVYQYDPHSGRFGPSAYYQSLLGDQSIRYLRDDASGNVWFIHDKTLGVIDVSGKKPHLIYLPELSNKLLSGFEFIYPVNKTNIILGGEKGFFHLNYEKYKKIVPRPKVQIRTVRILDQTDSLLFGGYFRGVNEKQVQRADMVPEISNNWKTIRLEFSSSLFEYQSNLEYSYRLRGFEDNWSEWSKRTDKEYTNLPAGTYAFEVKIKNNLQNVSQPAVFQLYGGCRRGTSTTWRNPFISCFFCWETTCYTVG